MVSIQLPQVLTLEDLVLLSALIIAGTTVALLVAAIARGGREKPKPTKPRQVPREKRLDFFHKLAKEMGLDKLLIRELEHIVRDGLEKGRVRLSLASDECPGYVVLDVPSRRFLCVHQDRVWPIGGKLEEETIEVEEEEEVEGHV